MTAHPCSGSGRAARCASAGATLAARPAARWQRLQAGCEAGEERQYPPHMALELILERLEDAQKQNARFISPVVRHVLRAALPIDQRSRVFFSNRLKQIRASDALAATCSADPGQRCPGPRPLRLRTVATPTMTWPPILPLLQASAITMLALDVTVGVESGLAAALTALQLQSRSATIHLATASARWG